MNICKKCGAPIVWIKTASGKAMPCDAEPVAYREAKGGSAKIVTPNGEVMSAEPDNDPQKNTGMGYVSHFATCPFADSFRRRQKADE